MRRRCTVSAFFTRGAGATEAEAAVAAFLARGARAFFTAASAVIEPAEYALSAPKTQYPPPATFSGQKNYQPLLFFGKIRPERQDAKGEKKAGFEPVLFLNGFDERDAEKYDKD